jgi:biopolymer transport protein TolQ
MNPADVAGSAVVAHDMSLVGLFWQAHIVVKLVMAGPSRRVRLVLGHHRQQDAAARPHQARDERFEEVFWSGRSLEELYRSLVDRPTTGLAALFVAAMREWKRSFEGSGRGMHSLSARIDKVLDVTVQREVERLDGGLLILASIGSAGPYIGLFGTVWGIMNSFTSIAASKNTSLAVVAPGIAEALFATAIGLFAAIPAVLAYNKLQAEVAKAQGRMEAFADEFSAVLSRQIDERIALAA